MRSQFEQQQPPPQVYQQNHPNPFSPPSITYVSNNNIISPSYAPVSTPKPSLTPVTITSNANNNMNPENLRESLSIVKRKAQERIGSASGSRDGGTTPLSARRPLSSGTGGGGGREGNQSTNRDSEDITPVIADEDDDVLPGDLIDRGESKRPSSSGSFYDTRYFEEKQRPLEQEYKLNDVEEDMGAAAALGGGKKANLALYLMKKQYPKMEREVSVESVSDDVGDDYIKSYSNDEREEGGNKTPGSRYQQQQQQVKYMQSNVSSNNRRYIYPNKFQSAEAGGSVPVQAINSNDIPPNIHHNFLKKSSSPTGAASALANKNKSSSPVPRLTAVEGGRLSRRDMDEKKASSSTSARIVRPEPVVDTVARPYSSKASFSYNDKSSSKANSAVNSPHTPDDRHHIEPTLVRTGSAGMMSSASTPVLAPYNNNGNVLQSWRCARCNSMNSGSADACGKCATKKGFAGERGPDSCVPRL
jgi:hypothetical protein